MNAKTHQIYSRKHHVLVIVPARGGSKRLPGKNIRFLAGRSLLAHTAEAIQGADGFENVILSTDDEDIATEGERLGWRVPFRRPGHLASDSATTIDAVLHALDWERAETGKDPQFVAVLQPTSPFRGSRCLTMGLDLLKNNNEIGSVIAMTELHVPANYIFTANEAGAAEPVDASKKAKAYVPNGALYFTRVSRLRQEQSLFAKPVAPILMTPSRSVDIDTEDDWRFAECLAKTGLSDDNCRFPPPDPLKA